MISVDDAPELAPYLDEPAQLPSGAPGKVGLLRLAFEHRDRRTVLADLFRQAPLLAQQALYWDTAMPEMACVFIITTSGGMLQGDRQRIDVSLGVNARAHLTTQAANKIQQMDANHAAQIQQITLADNAYLEYLPEPVIPYRNSRFITRTGVTLPESATMLYTEILLPGRKYHRQGEIFRYDLFSSTVRAARPGGPDLFVEKFVVEPASFGVARSGVLDDFHVFGNVVLLTSPERAARVYERTPPMWDHGTPLVAGVSRLPNGAGLIYKVLGRETEPVRAQVREFCGTARMETVGRALPPAFGWR
ncbi:urease accessory protein UreD [Micromonospora sp. NBC_01796]|uniref:urease accessory protein UreD n=1 Tax=Micromonospora sp. NBC_01796 TaxID=2975987 RepID=UPI002DDC4DE7|nr:urease accessory protein UreD [Micromonospora sp. NBC_01796]WSA84039.1 urease accessory protein UreD [Micromonospora sp. NBC_01796]